MDNREVGTTEAAWLAEFSSLQSYVSTLSNDSPGELWFEALRKATKLIVKEFQGQENYYVDMVLEAQKIINGLRDFQQYEPQVRAVTRLLQKHDSTLEFGSRWMRISSLFGSQDMVNQNAPLSGEDIHQTILPNCSFITSLIAIAEYDRKFDKNLGWSNIYPHNEQGAPVSSPSGMYQVSVYVNGTWQKLTICELVPYETKGETIVPHCVAVSGNAQLWPIILEKMYMAYHGGYDFKGSNSGKDLFYLTGWAPQHLPLHGTKFQSEKIWDCVFTAFQKGQCLLTLGTPEESNHYLSSNVGFVPLHNYAVLELCEDVETGNRHIKTLNPWASTTIEGASNERIAIIDWLDLPKYFSSIYINWDPSHFEHTKQFHGRVTRLDEFDWMNLNDPNQRVLSQQVCLDKTGELSKKTCCFILLSKCLTPYKSELSLAKEYISLDIVRKGSGDDTVANTTTESSESHFVDNDYLFKKIDMGPGVKSCSISCYFSSDYYEDKGETSRPYVLHVWSDGPVTINAALFPSPLYSKVIKGSWNRRTAGGNHELPSFYRNPQFRIAVSRLESQPVGQIIITSKTSATASINTKLVRAAGERVSGLQDNDVVVGTNTYKYGLNREASKNIPPGIYTLVVSSFEPEEEEFQIKIDSSLPLDDISIIPSEDLGLYTRSFTGSWKPGSDGGLEDILNNPRFSFSINDFTVVKIRLQSLGPIYPPLSFNLFQRDQYPCSYLESDAFSSYPTGKVSSSLVLDPRVATDYLIIPYTKYPNVHLDFVLHIYSDNLLSFS